MGLIGDRSGVDLMCRFGPIWDRPWIDLRPVWGRSPQRSNTPSGRFSVGTLPRPIPVPPPPTPAGILVLGVPVSIKRPNDAVSPMGMIGGVAVGLQGMAMPGQGPMLALPAVQVTATSPVICINEVLKIDDKTTNDDYTDVLEDMREGCGTHGKVQGVLIIRPEHAQGRPGLKPGDDRPQAGERCASRLGVARNFRQRSRVTSTRSGQQHSSKHNNTRRAEIWGAGIRALGRHDDVEATRVWWLRRMSREERQPEEGWIAFHRALRVRADGGHTSMLERLCKAMQLLWGRGEGASVVACSARPR